MPIETPAPLPVGKPTLLQRIAERYRWMSLRNKIGLWGLLAALIIGAVCIQWVQPAYRTTKMWFFLNMADKAIDRQDYNSASLAFRKALLSGQENPASWKALARFLDLLGSAEVINVWERLASMEPTVATYRYKQAEAALRFGRVYQAEEILAKMPAEWRTAPEGIAIEVEVNIHKKQFGAAVRLLNKLLEIKPGDPHATFQLMCLHAADEDPATSQPAIEALERLAAENSEFSTEALRRLIGNEQKSANLNEANRLAQRLIARPDATLQDRLLHAQFEVATNSFTLAITVANLRAYALQNPASFAPIMDWFVNSKVDPEGTARWVAKMPPDAVQKPAFAPPLFQYYLSTGDWDQVYRILKAPGSALSLSPKVYDLATKSIDEDRAGDTSADKDWQETIYAAEGQPRVLRILSLLASGRGWSSATGRALSALAEASPSDPSVWWLLVQHENSVRNLPGLYKALEGLMNINPYDINVASNWVLAAALVKKGEKDNLLDVAKRTYYSTYPSDPRAATAYALALLQVKRVQDALNVVEQMTLADRREPQRAIYVGAVLAANGRKEDALDYFNRSESLTDNSFSEERTLRRIWKGVALGEATTAEEAEQILIRNNDPAMQTKISQDLRGDIQRRSDPAEIQRIYQSLKAETESRRETPVEVLQILQEARKEMKP
jgi:tetratricopeptide (TPR) repeat protein